DGLGHGVGDTLLRAVAETIRGRVRKSDVLARLGGDEFALLLPETGYEAAQAAVHKLRATLLEVMDNRDWPVTFSMGAVTCVGRPAGGDAGRADQGRGSGDVGCQAERQEHDPARGPREDPFAAGGARLMKILVLVKQVPDTATQVKVAADPRAIDTTGITWIV